MTCTVFQPTLPVRGATHEKGRVSAAGYISTHAPRAGSDAVRQLARHGPVISTHAPRAGSDEGVERDARRSRISTHAPRAGSDELAGVDVTGAGKFQPAARGGGDECRSRGSPYHEKKKPKTQPTLPVRGATKTMLELYGVDEFQPTLPVRGATAGRVVGAGHLTISTHAPRAGSDDAGRSWSDRSRYFNPRSPCGERPVSPPYSDLRTEFQPTLPVRGATKTAAFTPVELKFQPTLPVRGATASSGASITS